MWLPEEERLFTLANHHNSHLEYEDAIIVADRLLALVQDDDRKYAYVLACRKAVALRHLDRLEEAETAFHEAYYKALQAQEPAICAYILNDWAAMRSQNQAEQMIRGALRWLRSAVYTPDPERILEADLAYLQATLAHNKLKTDPYIAYTLLKEVKKTLKSYAHGDYPRYNQAYLIVLLWNAQLPTDHSALGLLQYAGRLSNVAIEAIRQGKVSVAYKLLQRR
jgi:hypothetical protein